MPFLQNITTRIKPDNNRYFFQYYLTCIIVASNAFCRPTVSSNWNLLEFIAWGLLVILIACSILTSNQMIDSRMRISFSIFQRTELHEEDVQVIGWWEVAKKLALK